MPYQYKPSLWRRSRASSLTSNYDLYNSVYSSLHEKVEPRAQYASKPSFCQPSASIRNEKTEKDVDVPPCPSKRIRDHLMVNDFDEHGPDSFKAYMSLKDLANVEANIYESRVRRWEPEW